MPHVDMSKAQMILSFTDLEWAILKERNGFIVLLGSLAYAFSRLDQLAAQELQSFRRCVFFFRI